jgi:alginate O-acetyltransferase complex protein AlgI
MLFSSYEFIVFFLPLVFALYFGANKIFPGSDTGKWLLSAASLFFYGFWHPPYLVIILGSIIVNFLLAKKIQGHLNTQASSVFFGLGLSFNLGLLGYFKYRDFFLENVNLLLDTHWHFSKLALPLGISFFTLQQIAFLVDVYQGIAKEKKFIDYSLFVSFFPQLIAGPIVHYKDLIPQFESTDKRSILAASMAQGIFIFCLGLFKKVILADTFSLWANEGFDHSSTLHFFWAWGAACSYTLQLYFDFSGYSDMAIGLGLMFNIKIPQNFNSPFKARNVIDFWNRWHMTLSQFITSYVFTPFFRSFKKLSFNNSLISVFFTMMVAGLWHGAGWTFVVYGAMYGLALVVNHLMKKNKVKLPHTLAVSCTFIFTIFVFTMFRARSIDDALKVYKGMLGLSGVIFPKGIFSTELMLKAKLQVGQYMNNDHYLNILMILLGLWVVFRFNNSEYYRHHFRPSTQMALAAAGMFALSLLGINRVSDFIYFNF